MQQEEKQIHYSKQQDHQKLLQVPNRDLWQSLN